MEFSMLTVSEIEQLRSNGVRSLSPGDFNWLCAMALECAFEHQANEQIAAHLEAVDEAGEKENALTKEELDDIFGEQEVKPAEVSLSGTESTDASVDTDEE
jgi:hypothetical protein